MSKRHFRGHLRIRDSVALVTALFMLWCEMRAPGRSVRADPDWTERATREAIRAALEAWAHHPDAAGREHGDPVVTIAQSSLFEDTVGIVATLSEVLPR